MRAGLEEERDGYAPTVHGLQPTAYSLRSTSTTFNTRKPREENKYARTNNTLFFCQSSTSPSQHHQTVSSPRSLVPATSCSHCTPMRKGRESSQPYQVEPLQYHETTKFGNRLNPRTN
ncbi:hypothetical protein M3J09_007410 [Ascochyta lentis]